MMRGRFVRIGDTPVEAVKPSDNVAWALEGDRGVTFADKPPEGSEVVAGEWWPSDYSGPPLVSMEKEVAEGLGLRDRRHGRRQRARARHRGEGRKSAQGQLAQLRDQFRAGLFAQHLQGRALQRTRLRRSAAERPGRTPRSRSCARRRAIFPTVASVRVRDALESVETLVAKLALGDPRGDRRRAADVGRWCSPARWRPIARARLADATILKILGATRGRLIAMFLIEYALLGAATAAFRRRRGSAGRLLGGQPHHAVRFRLRLDRHARRRGRGPCDHCRARHDRRLAHPQPEAGGLPARM